MKKLKMLLEIKQNKAKEYEEAREAYDKYCEEKFGIRDRMLIDAFALINFVEKSRENNKKR